MTPVEAAPTVRTSIGERKWSPTRAYPSPFQSALRAPSHTSSTAFSSGNSLGTEDAAPDRLSPHTTRIPTNRPSIDPHGSSNEVGAPFRGGNLGGGESGDIQGEVLLRGGSYVRPDRVCSGDSAYPMESVPEEGVPSRRVGEVPRAPLPAPLSDRTNRDVKLGREAAQSGASGPLGAYPRGPQGMSPMRPAGYPLSPEDPNAPLMLTRPSGSGSGFPIGQLQHLSPQVPFL